MSLVSRFWVRRYEAGAPLRAIANACQALPNGQHAYGLPAVATPAPDAEPVNTAYNKVLGRPADAGGSVLWAARCMETQLRPW